MSRSVDELWKLLEESERLPYGAARIAMVEQVIRHCDALGDPDLSFSARMHGTSAYVYGGEPGKSFVTFSWCVSDFDRNPGPHHHRWEHNLLWQFKAEVLALTKFPEVPLSRTYAVLDDMERRYREGGHSMQAVHKHRFLIARHIGDQREAERLYELWTTAPRDNLSDCAGCDPTSMVNYLSDRDGDEEAIALAEPVLAGQLTCTQQPQHILLGLTEPYLRTGRLDQAVDAHRRAYRLIRGNLADLANIGDQVEFCARTGNEHRGLEILRRHIDWLDKAPSPNAGMEFAAAGALLMRRLTEIGHGDAEVRRGQRDVRVSALGEELAAYATGLAARFDARNGTSERGDRIAATLAAEPYGVVLPLSPTARRTPPPAPRPEPAPPVPEDLDAAALIRLADKHNDEDRDADLVATLAVFDKRFGDQEALAPEVAARRLNLRGSLLWQDQHDPAGAIEAWTRSAELFEAAGDPVEAATTRGQVGVAHCLIGQPELGRPLLEKDLALHEERDDARRRTAARARWALGLAAQNQIDEAIAVQRRAVDSATETGNARVVARHNLRLAGYLMAAERHTEAWTAADAALAFYRESGPDALRARAALLCGQAAEDPAEALAAYDEAVPLVTPENALEVHSGRGFTLMRLDRPADAVPDLLESVSLCTEQGRDDAGGFARLELARAYQGAGRLPEAAETAEEAVLWLDRAGQPQAADNARLTLAGVYRRLNAHEDALACYDDLIERLADNVHGRAQVREASADLLFRIDRDAEAAERFALVAEEWRAAGDALGEIRALRQRVASLGWAGQRELALETARTARERHAGGPDEPPFIWERAMLDYETASIISRRNTPAADPAAAVGYLDGLGATLRGIGAIEEAENADWLLADSLLRAGRAPDAEKVLRRMLDEVDEESVNRESVIQLLDIVLDEQGRAD